MSKSITIYDIAKCIGVSPATVSRALNNHRSINGKTKELILATAYTLGYKSNLPTRQAKEQGACTIGLILPRLDDNFKNAVLAGVETITAEAGYKLLFSQTQDSLNKEIQNAQLMFDSKVDGLLVYLSRETKNIDHFSTFLDIDIPVIFIERAVEHKKCISTVIDNMQAAHQATTHLIEQGCRNIVHLAGNQQISIYSDRLKGYKYAHSDSEILFREDNILYSDLGQEAGIAAAEKLLERAQLPDGIFASNDICAVACMGRLKKAGINIPEVVAVVGFGNDPIAGVTEPTLTSVEYSGYEMGEVAARNLILLMNSLNGWSDTFITKNIVLKSELIIRDSSRRNFAYINSKE